ncbi:type VI secretion system membrane subunit TssM [Roseibium sp. MMSF_3544]|uniref:type VI secretion system membrane subunit TssM n=1 Tax=unclassified Roseibium TaxID=2629323 RepID=UPI00273F1B76|nr:type VI secretion system membrane subunit TssM [Roseibium sp. MMSF_3544]
MFRTYLASLLRPASLLILLILIVISLIVLIWGGLLTVANVTPFAKAAPRVILAVVLILGFFLITFVRHLLTRRANAKLINSMLANDELVSMGNDLSADEVELIRERFESALKTLRDNPVAGSSSRNYLFELPWYIIIGPPGTGKTTILRNSGLDFPLAEGGHEAIQGVGGTRNCDWWISNEAVLIDTAGRYTTQDVNRGVDSAAWSGFLDLLLKHRQRRPINGVLLAVSVEDVALASEAERKQQAEILRQRLRELHRAFGMRLPVYLMFTKCDLIAGFDEYFDTLRDADRQQVWGVTFPYNEEQSSVGPVFETGFVDLVNRIERHLPEKLAEERNNGRRCRIYGFPHEFGSLSNVLRDFVSDVFRATRYEAQPLLRGIYFTSGTQEGTPFDRLLGAMGRSFSLAASQQPALSGQSKAFFIKKLLTDIVFPEQNLVGKNRALERRIATIYGGAAAALAVGVIGLCLYWIAGLDNAIEVSETTAQSADQVRVLKAEADRNRSLINLLPTLNAARDMRNEIEEQSNWLSATPISIEAQSVLYPAAERTYDDLLEEYLLPSINSRLEAQIQLLSTASDGNSTLLRDQLETYLMLTTGQNYNASKVKAALRAQNESTFLLNPADRAEMQVHMDNLESLLPISGTAAASTASELPVLDAARSRIQQAPQATDIYNRMVSDAAQRYRLPPVNIVRTLGSGSLYVDTANAGGRTIIPGLYTKNGFYNFFLERLPEYIRGSMGSDWVLGNSVNATTYNQVAMEVVKLYTDDYIKAWREGTAYIRVVDIGSLGRSQIVLEQLSSPDSPLLTILNVLRENTQLPLPGDSSDQSSAGTDQAAGQTSGGATGLVASASEASQRAAVQTAFGDAPWPGLAIEDAFRPLNNLVDPDSGASLDRVLQLFGDLYGNVSGVVTAPEPNKAAFDIVKSRAENPQNDSFTSLRSEAATKPEPVRSLVLSIVNRTWALLNQSAYIYINRSWQNEVVPVCSSIMAGRYPFFQDSEDDISLQDFADLLGPAGVVDAFFKDFVSPFVNIRGRQLVEIETQGANLGLSSESLAQLATAQTIRDAFFPAGAADPTAKFTIRPTFLDPGALKSTLKIDDDTMIYRHGPVRAKDFTWPSQADASSADISVTLLDNSTSSLKKTGTWAIFRLLTASGLSSARGRDQFVFSISKDNVRASFALNAGSVTNPFNLGLYSFRCPPSL